MIDYQKELISKMNINELFDYKAEIFDAIKSDVGHAEDYVKSVEYDVKLLKDTVEKIEELLKETERGK